MDHSEHHMHQDMGHNAGGMVREGGMDHTGHDMDMDHGSHGGSGMPAMDHMMSMSVCILNNNATINNCTMLYSSISEQAKPSYLVAGNLLLSVDSSVRW